MPQIQSAPRGLRLHIGIFGRRNAGKSSLLNGITAQNVSIVSDVAGTTTDPVEKPMELLPLGPVLFIDTAGIDDVGALGEERANRARLVFDRTELAILVLGLAFYAFALLGHFDSALGRTLRNAATLAVGYFPRTAGTLVFAASMWMLCVKFWRLLLPVLVLLGLALPVYIASIFFSDIFRKLEKPAEERETKS